MQEDILLSVIICTYNREGFLKLVLDSITRQTLPKNVFEVVVIDDGSSDNTREVAESFASLLPIRYFYQKNAGLASAKNHGIYTSKGQILLFLDDDDITTPALFESHIKTHRKHPERHMAVLHYTTWSPELVITPLMHFVTEVGCFLFSYPRIRHGEVLDYTYFWGGRSSCKRSFLLEYGVFNPVFRFGCEDIELGYRLSNYGLSVVYNGKAVSKMIRPVTFDEFCNRLIRQGRSQYVFSTLHDDPVIHRWTEVLEAEEHWDKIKIIYASKIQAARDLDKMAGMTLKYKLDYDDFGTGLLYNAYWWAFKACKIKGIMEAKNENKYREASSCLA